MGRVSEALKRAAAADAAGDGAYPHVHPSADAVAALGTTLPNALPFTTERVAAQPHHVPARPHQAPAADGDQAVLEKSVSRLPGEDSGDLRQLVGLIDRLFLPISSDPVRHVAFTGVGDGVASAPIAAACAELIARRGNVSVCLVDANFRSPSLHDYFGISDAVAAAPSAARVPIAELAQEVRTNLWVLTASGADRLFGESIETARPQMADLITRFDYVVFDMEPVSARGEAGPVAPLVEGVILVVAESTRREAGRRTVSILREAGTSVFGAVLTDRSFPIPAFFYRRI